MELMFVVVPIVDANKTLMVSTWQEINTTMVWHQLNKGC